MSWNLLTDEDVWSTPYTTVVDAMNRALVEHAAGTLVSPPRWTVDIDDETDARLVFTAGGAETAGVFGFRVYETFPDRTDAHEQLVAVWDGESGAFRGLCVGHAVGVLRTGGLGGVAVDALARDDATTVGVLGSGPQARAQLEAIAVVRDIDTARVFSPTIESRESFAATVDGRLNAVVEAVADPETAVRGADVLVCATNSTEPVFEADWLDDGTHVSTLGPKYEGRHELPLAVTEQADTLATDSLAQVESYPRPFFITPGELVELSSILDGRESGRTGDGDVTLYCSVGLAGTEVVLADELLSASSHG